MHFPDLRVLRAKKKPLHERELIYSYAEIAKTLGLSLMTIYRYRIFPDFPNPITSKAAVTNWARHRGLPRKRGPYPGEMRKEVVQMRKEGRTFRQIGQVLGISRQAAHGHWKRHQSGTEAFS